MSNAPDSVLRLVERFEANRDEYKSGAYNETQARREFIDPLFTALGWDVDNREGLAEAYKDVIHEDAIKVGGSTKAPDYCFRIGGTRKFFVEAKKPAVALRDDIDPAYQLRRYAWSAKLPVSILTDFEEFAVYDGRVRPSVNDKPSAARVLMLTYADYPARWDELDSVFSKQAVLHGSFDRFAAAVKKRGTAEVDDQFLDDIERWRDALARNLALRNANLTVRELNFAVGRIIDRIIFLRMCEDRGVEPLGRLQALLGGADAYARLRQIFVDADNRYNSGLFHFTREPGREAPDELTLNLAVDDKVLKDILRSLYYPESPYEFSVLPPDILGNVYEQFLGKVIHLTAGHQARVEEKPEVKKAGGVYYTPKYIVDYIVENTLGRLLSASASSNVGGHPRVAPLPNSTDAPPPEKQPGGHMGPPLQEKTQETASQKTPKQAAKLKILDPACGSGSFLVGAYRRLLDWHRDWYVSDGPEKHRRELYQGSGGRWLLTTAEKKRILLNNIFGVDIDAQAVEVTKLNLLLCVLENENQETINQLALFHHERALPDLSSNIKCGNSLIGPDFYDAQQGALFDDDTRYRINAFDWTAEFPAIMKAGGFDCVIGNPPYIRIQTMKEWAPVEVELYKERYRSAGEGNYDIYVVFVEKALRLLNKNGELGFILPHKFFNAQYGKGLRKIISEGKHLSHVVHFGDQQVFEGATTYTALLFLDKSGCPSCRFTKVDDLPSWRISSKALRGEIDAASVRASEWNFGLLT